ncbi:MAG: AAA family ATPase [Gemmatimonadota bacterium]
MRIEHFDIAAFGRLEDFDSGADPLPSLVVVLGPNEAGKSTIFEFLTTLLYGFAPASRELNPLVPWGTDEAGGSLVLSLHDDRTAEVTRRLRSQPAGQLQLGDRTTDLRNQPVPWVEHVPRRVFRQVFAVTLRELASLDEETWVRIQDRVIGSMGAADLRPVREVVAELEREAGELWRPNRRGNQKVREARERMRSLRARRREATDRDRELRAKVDELERTHRKLHAKRDRRAKDEAEVERAQLLAPVRAQLARIESLRAEAGPPEWLADLPARPHERLAELEGVEARIASRLAELEAERAELLEAVAERTPAIEAIIEHRDQITRFVASTSKVAADRDRVVELRAEIDTIEEGLDRMSRDLVGKPWVEAPQSALLDTPPGAARDAVERVERARRAGVAVPSGPDTHTHPSGSGAWWGAVLLLVLGLSAVGWGVRTTTILWSALGAAMATAAAAWVWIEARERRARAAERAERERDRNRTGSDLRQAHERFGTLTRELTLADRHVEEPGSAFVTALERLHELADLHRNKARAHADAADRLEAADRQGRALARRLSVACDADDGPEEVGAVLSSKLRQAERIDHAAGSASGTLERLDRTYGETAAEFAETREELAALRDAAARFTDGPASEALERAARRLEAHRRAMGLEEELQRSHPDLDVLRTRIEEAERAGAKWIGDERDLVLRRARIQALTAEIEELAGKTKELAADIEHAGGRETADWVDGEIATLEADTAELVRERDRKWVLARLLRDADRRFREEHQPDLMRRASAYLAHLTEGRYDRILAEESDDRDLFRIAGPELAGPIPLAHPISTGTLEQAYLSLRLAIVDHLDHGAESLPLFIDEVFVNWDSERRSRGLEAITQIAEARQVFVFTCHPPLARELEDTGARLIRLERG